MGAIGIMDSLYCIKYKKYVNLPVCLDCRQCNEMLRIPLPAPLPGREVKRTLLGMVDWKKWVAVIQTTGDVEMSEIDGKLCFTATPYLALLRAIAAQEGVEVK